MALGMRRPQAGNVTRPRVIQFARRLRRLTATGLVPIVLSTVAVAQIALANFGNLSPWKGGGFGMFASIDAPSYRSIAVHARDNSGERFLVHLPYGKFVRPAALSSSFFTRIRSAPSERLLRELAAAVAVSDLAPASERTLALPSRLMRSNLYASVFGRRDEAGLTPLDVMGAYRPTSLAESLTELRVEVATIQFDVRTATVRRLILVGVTIPLLPPTKRQ